MNNKKTENNLQISAVSQWRNRARFRVDNKKWLRYSGKIALRILAAMEDKPELNQKRLAELAGVSPQQVSKILKGQQNLTLQTIAKFGEILGTELIAFPSFKYNQEAPLEATFNLFPTMVFVLNVNPNDFYSLSPITSPMTLSSSYIEIPSSPTA